MIEQTGSEASRATGAAEAGGGAPPPEPRVLARRIAQRRRRLGLSESALATQAGMPPRHLQEMLSAGADFDPGGLLRVVTVLRMTYQELIEGGAADQPIGEGDPAPRPVLVHLTESECWDRIGSGGLGRVALPVTPGPAVFPVNYGVEERSIVYRTAVAGAAVPDLDATVSFEVDRLDDRVCAGWSVLVIGAAELIEDPDTVWRLTERHATEPWAGGDLSRWIRIRPQTVSGRRVGTV
ncbi:pyridoxamine 5'-phosphate oxidase family protein [Streptomyces sp. CA-111067]|uniref:pyridoxamine 5'-phosphate oxidase family protein n=1 Tax=Streptomyces sp. CA-111067 TaxID=3240046 RepID=UPI003D97A16B